jgi:hypothetical protein
MWDMRVGQQYKMGRFNPDILSGSSFTLSIWREDSIGEPTCRQRMEKLPDLVPDDQDYEAEPDSK